MSTRKTPRILTPVYRLKKLCLNFNPDNSHLLEACMKAISYNSAVEYFTCLAGPHK